MGKLRLRKFVVASVGEGHEWVVAGPFKRRATMDRATRHLRGRMGASDEMFKLKMPVDPATGRIPKGLLKKFAHNEMEYRWHRKKPTHRHRKVASKVASAINSHPALEDACKCLYAQMNMVFVRKARTATV